jgi:DNA-binding CsgD family transcriptional regulator
MAATRRILAASSRPELFEALQNQTARRERWSIAGPVDPKIPGLFEQACDDVDVALIEADDLVWLANNRAKTVGTALQRIQTIVILSEGQLLDVLTLPVAPDGLLFRGPAGHVPVDRLALSLDGYLASPGPLLGQLSRNLHRLEIVNRFSPEEMEILAHLGAGLPNRTIAEITGLAESRVKTVTHALTHKLRMNNRTAVAVFAATNGLSPKPGMRDLPLP